MDDFLSEDTCVLVSVQTPEGVGRQPSDLTIVIDTSGSMSTEATIQGEGGVAESHGLSLLDVAKHGVRTIIKTLNEADRLALVNFHNDAITVLPLTAMDEKGRALAEEKLGELSACGGTDIWKGLEHGLEALRGQTGKGRFGHVMLLTDGESTARETIVPNLEAYKKKYSRLPGTVNTFGFGYRLDSELLTKLATLGNGSYSFIPDAGFVGTAFVNTMSTLLVTMAQEVFLDLEAKDESEVLHVSGFPVVKNFGVQRSGFKRLSLTSSPTHTAELLPTSRRRTLTDLKDMTSSASTTSTTSQPSGAGSTTRVNLGTLQYGQSKDVVVSMKVEATGSGSPFLVAKLSYETRCSDVPFSLVPVEAQTLHMKPAPSDLELVQQHECRMRFAEELADIVGNLPQNGRSHGPADTINSRLSEAKVNLEDAIKFVKDSPSSKSEYVEALLEDMCGQSLEALSKVEWFSKWGVHYLPSLMFAHRLQQCNNFKDPGVQHYGGKLFSDLRDEADDIFNSLPPPKPSVNRQRYGGSYQGYSSAPQAPVSMAAYNNACGG